ncbi:MAG: putative DNA-binding domain-containing protein, partial [Gammaproteobacteria bacterium]|nr:putative DNA-binding domain-containing protein [Gammaproteobacteria bacterium]
MSSTTTKLPFQTVQTEFAAHIRDPDLNRGPSEVEPRRMAIYKRLFYENIESFCAKSFKTFRAVVDDEYWHSIVRGFIKSHQCETPYFREIPNEFLLYLTDQAEPDQRYPFMV